MPNPQNVINKGKNWMKGRSGNPNGRPKKIPALDELFAAVLSEEKGGMTAGERILRALCKKALRGDVRCAELLLDRAYGKVRQNFEHNINGELLQNVIGKLRSLRRCSTNIPHVILNGEADKL